MKTTAGKPANKQMEKTEFSAILKKMREALN